MFKNKLWLLVGAGLVATSAMTSGLAHAEVCVENDAGLTEQQLSVAFTATKDASPQNPIDWHRLPNGEEYCQGSDGTPLYLALQIRIAQNAGMGFAIELHANRTPKVTAGDGGRPTSVRMDAIRAAAPQPR